MILLHANRYRDLAHDIPGTFPSLMDLYERNYINMRRLLPIMPTDPVTLVSSVPEALNLYLQFIERFPYTSELILTYQFEQGVTKRAEPNLRIRIYHDARQAEVMTAQRRYPANGKESVLQNGSLYARWQTNRFLYKWLSYCLHQGHHFGD
ncbi:MAG: hypothetical protein CSA09_00280 [Candidatus Contendobacter odensis]|uniref:DUF1249 domain-containing protein n=1 Tax=Candidatus Contendibacter odensensis TaxID=1400860 RepID=A0A2G6PGM2_9GAMM|nr:MAG: hypothetical protein CSA09_00280 [Candidatus Contendobacter odensis]